MGNQGESLIDVDLEHDRGPEPGRRTFLRMVLVGSAVAAVPAAVGLNQWAGSSTSFHSFEIEHDEDIALIFHFGSAAGLYDIMVRRNGEVLERFADVQAEAVVDLRSDHFTVRRADAPVAS